MKRVGPQNSSSALYILFAEGCCFLMISVAVIACGFVLNFQDDFDYEKVDSEHDYTQYWVGFLLLITAFLAIAAGTRQRTRWVVVSAMFFFFVTILVSLFALVIEGNDWVLHKNAVRRKGFWESEDYSCNSPTSTSCVCTKTGGVSKMIASWVDCDTLQRLDYLYGGLICCILVAVFLALSSIVVVLIFIPIRPLTVPVPKKRIRKITILEDEKPKPIVVYKPRPKPEPKPEVEEIVIRERQPQRMRVVVEPKPLPPPKPVIKEIVVRERPRPRTIVYDEPRRSKIVYSVPPRRQPTLVYDEPRQTAGPMYVRTVVQEPKREILNRGKLDLPDEEQPYDVGRFLPKVHPTPAEPRPEIGVDEGFITNPNFKKPSSNVYKDPEPIHYGREEIKPVRYSRREPEPVSYVRREPEVVRYVRREELKPEPVRYVRKPTIVYQQRPRVHQERALVPVQRPVARPVVRQVVRRQPPPHYIEERPGHRPRVVISRQRANSDEGPHLYRPREAPPPRRRVYTAQPGRAIPKVEDSRRFWQRVRSNSDEGPRLYRQTLQSDRPSRIYTDRERGIVRNESEIPRAAGPRVFTSENIGTANLGHSPLVINTAQASQREEYDTDMEANLTAADNWDERPNTPY